MVPCGFSNRKSGFNSRCILVKLLEVKMKTHCIGIDGNSGIERKREKAKGKGEILEEKAKIKECLSR